MELGAITLMAAAVMFPAPANAAAVIGAPAPAFRLTDASGRAVALADFRGRTVVIEWTNPGCPFVAKHYGGGNMQRTQTAALRAGAVWLTINSGGPGKQGHLTGTQARAQMAATRARPAAYLLDPDGVAGHAYGARTTPHLFVVNPAGTLVYAGAIDDRPTADPADIAGARNHVLAALAEMKAGKPVSVPTSRPYGCAVKYAVE